MRFAWIGAILLLMAPTAPAYATILSHPSLERVNRKICGHVLDYTHNHGADRRLCSAALHQKRDLYVYLPPGYDCSKQYPIMIWLHGFAQDEKSFLEDIIERVDREIACGKLPPMIIAAPDGSLSGEACLMNPGSFFVNSKAGAFEDYLMQDVWPFLLTNFPIRPEAEAHVLAGVSMGGGAAYNLGIKYRHTFKVIASIFPPLNVRWLDCHCRYMGNFDPCCWGWRTEIGLGLEPVGRFYGIFVIRARQVFGPLYGTGPDAVPAAAKENPIEMLDTYNLQEGQLDMYIGYGGRDQFNIDAQVESFLCKAREKGLTVTVGYEPKGRHDRTTAYKLFPGAVDWLACKLAVYRCLAPQAPAQ